MLNILFTYKCLVYFLISIVLLTGCKKDTTEKDISSLFAGKYECHRTGFETCMGITTKTYYDSIIYIIVTKVDITHLSLLGTTIEVNSKGEFGKNDNGDCIQYPSPQFRVFCGKFDNNSIQIYTFNGGLGCSESFQYQGRKIN